MINKLLSSASFSRLFKQADDAKKLKLLQLLDETAVDNQDADRIKKELFQEQPDLWGPLFSLIKKNPRISLNDFIAAKNKLISDNDKKQQGKALKYTEEESAATANLSNSTFRDWALRALKAGEILRKEPNRVAEVREELKRILHFAEEKIDITAMHSKYDGPNGYNQALLDARLWENEFKNFKGTSYKTNEIVFKTDNYIIVEIKGDEENVKNDLKLEGKILNHCVGDYTESVIDGQCRIFSLRDSSNKPQATIETDPGIFQFRQIYGYGNSTVDDDRMIPIRAWQNSLHPKEKILEMALRGGADTINAALFMNFNDPDYKNRFNYLLNDNTKIAKEYDYTNEVTSVHEALAENQSLSTEEYDLVYNRADDNYNMTAIAKLARNPKISDELFVKIYNNATNYEIYDSIAMSMKLKNHLDIATKLLDSKPTTLLVLNNPSIPSRTCIDYMKQNMMYVDKDLFRSISYAQLEPKFIDDLINSRRELANKEYMNEIFIGILRENTSKIRNETFFKLLNAYGVNRVGNDTLELINELLLTLKGLERTVDNKYEKEAMSLYFVHEDNKDIIKNIKNTSLIEYEFNRGNFNDMGSTFLANKNTPSHILEKVYNKNIDNITGPFLGRLLEHPNCPVDIFNKYNDYKYFNYNNIYLIESKVKNINCPSEVLKDIYNSYSSADQISTVPKIRFTEIVRMILAHKNCPSELLSEKLNKLPIIIADVKEKSKNSEDYQKTLSIKLSENQDIINICKNPNTPAEILRDLFEKTTYSAGGLSANYIVSNPNCPQDKLDEAVMNSLFNYYIHNIIQNPNLSEKSIRIIHERAKRGKYEGDLTNEESFFRYMYNHKNLPLDLIEEYLNNPEEDDYGQTIEFLLNQRMGEEIKKQKSLREVETSFKWLMSKWGY